MHGPAAVGYNLHILVEKIENLPLVSHDCSLVTQLEWRGSQRKAGLLGRGFVRNYTCPQQVQANSTVRWNEEFNHVCKLTREKYDCYRSWIVGLEIKEVQQKSREKRKIVGKAQLDVAGFVQLEDNKRSVRIPINCTIKGDTSKAMLLLKLVLIDEDQPKERKRSTLTRSFSLNCFSSGHYKSSSRTTHSSKNLCSPLVHPPATDSSSSDDDEPDLKYSKLSMANLLMGSEFTSNHNNDKRITGTYIKESCPKATVKEQKQRPFARPLLWNRIRLSFNRVNQPKGPPLLDKAFAEDGGDDIDKDCRNQSCIQFLTPFKQVKVQPEEKFKYLAFEDSKFEVGHWEKNKIVSRDGKMELQTDVFLASIDQCSKLAAGGSACTVLAAVIADWLHNNPNSLPLRCQFDKLVKEGSSEWRELCKDENHKVKFSDKHFDLDTVLDAKIRPLTVVTEKSHVGFFSMEEKVEGFDFLQGEMSIDTIWNEILGTDTDEARIYIAGWNDHFFVLKVESDVIYLIDTLGERLSEGCNQAYILKFDAESAIYWYNKDGKGSNGFQHVVSEGTACCKEYIKGFLSALPLRQLQQDIKRGTAKQDLLYRLLQIDFHYTAPCTTKA